MKMCVMLFWKPRILREEDELLHFKMQNQIIYCFLLILFPIYVTTNKTSKLLCSRDSILYFDFYNIIIAIIIIGSKTASCFLKLRNVYVAVARFYFSVAAGTI